MLMPLRLIEGVCLLRYFPINNPVDDMEQGIYYKSTDDKNQLLQDTILDYWSSYCNNHWIWLGKFEEYRWNYEDKVKRFLNRCANFLLIGNYRDYNILSGNDIGRIIENELSLEGDWENDDIEIELEETIDFLNNHIRENTTPDRKILETKYDNKPVSPTPSKRKLSKFDKIQQIYSMPDKQVDEYVSIHISHTFNVWDKNVRTIKGRQGLIDKSKPYTAKWCIVDTENIFLFNEQEYKIDKSVRQYNPRNKKPKYDDYRNDYNMDKILVYEQNGNMFFFDQNIDRIENELIKEI